MVKLFWVTETKQTIHFECVSVKLSVASVAGDHVYWCNWIIFYIEGNHQASIRGSQVMGPLTMLAIQREP